MRHDRSSVQKAPFNYSISSENLLPELSERSGEWRQTMRTIVIDDELFALNSLLKALDKLYPYGEHIGMSDPKKFLAYMKENYVDAAFIDINLGEANGLELIKQLQDICPQLNVIVYTAHPEYKAQALDLWVSGYLVKPLDQNALEAAMRHLRYPVKQLWIRCFGYFEVFYDSRPVKFSRKDSKEVFAYLIDKRGAEVSEDELRYILWEEHEDSDKKKIYIRNIIYDIRRSLEACGVTDVVLNSKGSYAINTPKLNCDYFDYLRGKKAVASAMEEYMEQYSSWSIQTKSKLFDIEKHTF